MTEFNASVFLIEFFFAVLLAFAINYLIVVLFNKLWP